MEKIEAKRMYFFNSYWIAAQRMPTNRDRLSFFDAIFSYAFDDRLIEMTSTAETAFTLVFPVLEASRKQPETGRKSSGAGKADRRQNKSMPKTAADVLGEQIPIDNRKKEKEKEKEEEKEKEKKENKKNWSIHYD